MTTTWTPENQTAAQAEGWDIFDTCGDTKHDPFELCRLDDPQAWDHLDYTEPKFDGDKDVWFHVWARANTESPLHVAAVAFLREHSPGEVATIEAEVARHNDAVRSGMEGERV